MWIVLSCAAAVLWLGVWLTPWRPWSTRERLDATDADRAAAGAALDDVTALVPARNEAALIAATVTALAAQGSRLRIIVIDDQSSDGTAEHARRAGAEVLASAPLPAGWTGKLWALEQGSRQVATPRVLLVDADITLAPGTLRALLRRMSERGAQLVSLAAEPRLHGAWERLLLPAFIYFFRLLYPFHLANARSRHVAAAAGGCVLVERRVLDALGGFCALRGALIDDCTLARLAKDAGFRTWIGLTRSARSQRPCASLASVWEMVARTAFTQLRYSSLWLAGCTLLMLLAFAVPVAGLFAPNSAARAACALACLALCASYVPLLRFYDLNTLRAATLPLAAGLFLAMTWGSALRYWRGTRSTWKGRIYERRGDAVGGPSGPIPSAAKAAPSDARRGNPRALPRVE